MLESLLFALNATVPIILVVVIGWLLNRRRFFNHEFLKVLDRLIYRVMLPCLLFRDVSAGRLTEGFDRSLFWFSFVTTILYFAVIWIGSELLIRDKSIIGAFVQGSYRGSVALLGVSFMQAIYGDSGVMPLIIVAVVPLYNIFAVVLLTLRGDNGTVEPGQVLRRCLRGLVTNPILIGIFFGLLASFLHLELPQIASRTVNYFAVCTTPLALLLIGAEFEGGRALQRLRPTLCATFIKLIALPACILPAAVLCGFRGEALVAQLIVVGAPSTAAGYIMAKNMHNDAALASSIVMLTTALSAVTITLALFVLRWSGLI